MLRYLRYWRINMTQIQKTVLIIFFVDLCGILVLQHYLEVKNPIIGIVLYTVILSMVLGSLLAPRKTKIHRIVGYAIMFIAIGDFFLVLLGTQPFFPDYEHIINPAGMFGFMCAYATLIWVFTRNFSLTKKDLVKTIPVLLIVGPVLLLLIPRIQGPMIVLAIIFSIIVSFMAWNALCCIHRGFYCRNVAIRFALAGFLMLLSDMGVAFALFYPGTISTSPWLQNEIWITYIPAWTLIFVNLLEEKLAV